MEKLVIVWAWWGWYTAGIYAWRYNLNPIIIWSIDWWMIVENPVVENFPGFDEPTNGFTIMEKMKKQALKYWAKFIQDTVESILPINENDFSKWYIIKTSFNWTIQTKSLILAIGTKKNKLNIAGENEFFGRWVSYCATCDGFFYKWKTVAVVGWWDTAFIEALYLSNICKKVYLIHRREEFRAEPIRIDKLKEKDNVEFVLNAIIEKIWWENKVSWIDIIQNWNTRKIELDGIFIAIGMTPNSIEWLDKYLEREKKYIKVNNNMATNLPWVFAAGDCTTWNGWFRQLIVACAEWAVAAESAFKYLNKN